ncbi:scarecrow-like protein 1 isoform X1 [Macadamia integrifolia]|uniref:scarecrow-like protein 1 isoform X1 n=1 Tax=Macadamia integrifolia TaxID=60698 RepID=UPI001C4E875D|nr:scarecrow-like protein 1 isoform X1 [Macadamia integrifolia]XP_042495285.1 scarecrow-like protein 1 isoform X1 [Macadamia integrifolia]XP_042495286.1 scarecrow-like protein 1 isoform X1 [Macadamia integrifolia]
MSLVKPADPSATSYGKSQLYMLKGSSDTTRLSSQAFSSDKRKFKYGPESYCCESYNQQYFSESPGEDFLASQNEFCHPSSTDVSRFSSQGVSSYQLMTGLGSSASVQTSFDSFAAIGHPDGYQSQSSSEYYGQSPENGTLDYEDDDIRFKLKELERELLNDNDDNERFVLDQSMDIDGEWTGPIKDLLLPNSPKESSSSDSNLSSISSNKETSLLNHVSTPNSSRTPTAKQLLFECAAAISDGNMEEAAAIIAELRQRVSIQGDPAQRIAAYMVEGLAARMAASGKFLYKALKCKEPPTLDRLAAMQILFEVCPCFKFGFMAANGAIAEAFKDEERVHIIDFDVNQGSQYMTLIQAFAARPGKPPNVRITGVDDPESVQRTVGGLNIIGQRLEKLAEQFGVPFEFRAVPAKTEDVTPAMLDCRPSEALVVNFAFQLHHMPDESVSTLNQRDQLLRMVKSLNPKLVTVVEQDVNTNTAPFFPRFVEAYNYYSAVFESLDATLSRESPDRINVERQCLARDIVNIVACEGEERIERYELAGKWRARMMMAGFQSCPLSAYVNETIRKLLKQYCDRYKIKEEGGALHFGWEERILVVASAWK